jgi:hypothetical protein
MVEEGDMDFQNYKHRPEFAEDHGGGSIYGGATDGSERGLMTPPVGFGSPATSRPSTPSTLGPRRGPSPLPLAGGYRGTDYFPVPSTQAHAPPSPGFRHHSRPSSPCMSDRGGPSPEPITDYAHHDNRSETESVRHLLSDHQQQQPGPSHHHQRVPPSLQQRRYDSYEDYTGVDRR